MKVSVEIEPPTGVYTSIEERDSSIEDEIIEYIGHVEMLSITNRPVFGLSAVTMAKRVYRHIEKLAPKPFRVSLHLTTRLPHHDLFRNVLDAHRIGLSDLLPILGDPRGPRDPNYFENGFDILGFSAYLRTGNKELLTSKYQGMLDKGQLVEPINGAEFSIGSVININPVKITSSGKTVNIRDRQLSIARKKQKHGAEYLISQGSYQSQSYFDFVEQADLDIPVIAGLLPARTRLIDVFGLPIDPLQKQMLRAQLTSSDEISIGNKMAHDVYKELEDGGCEQAHVYSIGNANNFKEIVGIDRTLPAHDRMNFEASKNSGIKSP
jgi:5,10-methylenetetrahydrofolate reductase